MPYVSPPPTASLAKTVINQVPSMDVQSATTAPCQSPFDHPGPSPAYRDAGMGMPSSSSLRAYQAPLSGSGTPNNPRSASVASLSPSQRGSLGDETSYDALCMPLPPAPDSTLKRSPQRSPVVNAQGHNVIPRPSPTRLNGQYFAPSTGTATTAAAAATAGQGQVPRRHPFIPKVCFYYPWLPWLHLPECILHPDSASESLHPGILVM